MKTALILAAALLAAPLAHSEFLVMRTHNASITLTDNTCPQEVAQNLKPEFVDKFKEAWMVFGGQTLLGCWIRHFEDPNIAVIMTETGQAFGVELSAFKVDTGV